MDYPKRILIVGNGGRENAIGNALLLSEQLEGLWITPANWGLVDHHAFGRVHTLAVKPTDLAGIVNAALEIAAELVVVGPEDPLCAGLADRLREAGIPAVGPGADAAQLEGSKRFAKQFMARHGIPTAEFAEFSELDALLTYIASGEGPLVLKADGLAAGKGVIVAANRAEAAEGARVLLEEKRFGAAGSTVLAEECLFGREISFTVLISGGRAEVLPPSSDYKRLQDDDFGPNTGGMGNICPTPWATDEVIVEFSRDILAPFMRGLRADGLDYRGFLFVGTMLTESGLKVIEFNTRFGDPEAEVVIPLCSADWPLLLAHMAAGELPQDAVVLRDGACVAVVLASGNYPYGKSEPAAISGIERLQGQGLLELRRDGDAVLPPQVSLHFAGVSREGDPGVYENHFSKSDDSAFLASGGRVLALSAMGADLSAARRLAYEAVGNLHFEGMQFRTDIGKLR
ncbi:MAG: phosphoribosylamine--glycine ligase [Planctomycetales bacterium]|nr:phosphoribosylamine--glycine ligase [bacterium]UNM08677.1 MAG: phosphoribosylamine--glycine ligase [Planctomycetales bacterium]